MKLSVSQIAWTTAENEPMAKMLAEHGVESFEFAPSLLFPGRSTDEVTDDEIRTTGEWWATRGLRPVAAQSLLFNRPDVKLFGTEGEREALLRALSRVIRIAGSLGAIPLVFGSPGNRRRGGLSPARAHDIASDFFRAAGAIAERHGCILCIEPNAVDYGCDFINTLAEAAALVRSVDHPGFALNVDAGVMRMEGDGVDMLREALPLARHFHISNPYLAPVGGQDEFHGELASVLRECQYDGYVSIEMRKTGEDDNVASVRTAVEFAQRVYLDG